MDYDEQSLMNVEETLKSLSSNPPNTWLKISFRAEENGSSIAKARC
jgi:hypothetical protein